MTDKRILFSGLTEAHSIPRTYKRLQRRHGSSFYGESFDDVLSTLEGQYNIEWRDLAYFTDEELGTTEPVDHYRALVNPSWVGLPDDRLPDGREDAVWHIPTKKYTKVSHSDAWESLYEAIRRRGAGDDVFGTARIRRNGGEVHMDVFFESANLTTEGEEITLGISTGHDYYGNVRLYVDVVAYHDTGDGVGQVMRYLVDPKRRKHTGDADEEVVAWFDDAVRRLETVSDSLYNIIANAMHYEIPLSDIPCSVIGFYKHLGLPDRGESTLATPAGERAVEMAVGPYTAWHMYKAGMWAIEHHYGSRDTSSFTKHVNTVNTLLFNPGLAEKQVLKAVEEEIVEKRHDDDADIHDYMFDDPDITLDTIRSRATSISEGVEEYKSIRDKLSKMLQDEGVVESEPELRSGEPIMEDAEAT